MSANVPIYKGDNSGAFGNSFITVNLINPLNYPISKVIFVCGCLKKEYKNPVFPWIINFTSDETTKFNATNICYLVAYDSEGRQKTCQGTLIFKAQNGVICNGRT